MSTQKTDDIFLLRRIKDDDETAFKFLFETYFVSLYRLAHFYVKEEVVAEEIALDVFTAFWEKRKTIEIKISIQAYLLASTRNRSFNYLRDKKNVDTTDDLTQFESVAEDYSIEIKELEQLIEAAITSLPDKCKEVFVKSRSENLTNKEIASQMNITTKTVEAQITKALKHIRSYLGKSYHYLW